MAGFLGNQPPKVPLTSADIADGTVTANDLNSTLNLSSKTVTLPASSVTSHVTSFDDADIRSDILKLALHQAIDGNRVAYSLEDSFIDGFEDSSGIDSGGNLTDVARDTTGEYVNTAVLGTSVYVTGDRTSTITVTDDGVINDGDGVPGKLVDGDTTSNSGGGTTFYVIAITEKYIRFQFSTSQVVTEAKWYQATTHTHGNWKWQGSNDATSWTDIGASFALGGSLQTQTELNGNTTSYTYYQLVGVSGNSSGSPWVREVEFKVRPTTTGATGTLISDPQTASTSRTSASGVIIYEDAAGTSTLGTDLKIYFSCDNSAWTEAASYGTATTYSGTKKLVKLGATTCTAGTSVAMKAVWANQSASKEARLHGWAVNY